jgi:hypothetical protein
MYYIPIHGKARSGKNEVARFLKEDLERLGFRVRIDAFSKPVKELVGNLFGLTAEEVDELKDGAQVALLTGDGSPKVISLRRTLQWLGTEVGRGYVHSSFWVYRLLQRNYDLGDRDVLIVPDARFRNELLTLEIDYLERMVWGVWIPSRSIRSFPVKIIGRGGLQGKEAEHPSEAELPDELFRFIICNDGTMTELKTQVKLNLVPRFLQFAEEANKNRGRG